MGGEPKGKTKGSNGFEEPQRRSIKRKRPRLNVFDSKWSLFFFVALLITPPALVFIFWGGPPGEFRRLVLMALAGSATISSLVFAAGSFLVSRRDKAWEEAIKLQKIIYDMNRDWVEDELRLLELNYMENSKNPSQKRAFDAIRTEKETFSKGSAFMLRVAYRNMLYSGRNLRESARTRAEEARIHLDGNPPGPFSAKPNGNRGAEGDYSDSLRVSYSLHFLPMIENAKRRLEELGHETLNHPNEKPPRFDLLVDHNEICPEALRVMCELALKVKGKRKPLVYYSPRRKHHLEVKMGDEGGVNVKVSGETPIQIIGKERKWSDGNTYSLSRAPRS